MVLEDGHAVSDFPTRSDRVWYDSVPEWMNEWMKELTALKKVGGSGSRRSPKIAGSDGPNAQAISRVVLLMVIVIFPVWLNPLQGCAVL